MDTRAITPRQRQLLAFLVERITSTGLCPNWREIMAHMGYGSTNAVFGPLQALARAGLLKWDCGTNVKRNITVPGLVTRIARTDEGRRLRAALARRHTRPGRLTNEAQTDDAHG